MLESVFIDSLFIPLILPYYAEDRERIKKVSDREDFCAGTKSYDKKLEYLQGKIDLSKLLDCYIYVCGCYVVWVATLACAILCVKNFINYVRYDNEIEAYQRRLK